MRTLAQSPNKIAVLITDGDPRLPLPNPEAALLAAANAAKAEGITVAAVGLFPSMMTAQFDTQKFINLLGRVASGNYVYNASNALPTIETRLGQDVCALVQGATVGE